MPRKPISNAWVARIYQLAAEPMNLNPKEIEQEFAKRYPDGEWPSRRTIERHVARFRAMDLDKQQEHAEFRWPETMQNEILPWEAAPFALELLRLTTKQGPFEPMPPGTDLTELEPESIAPPERPLVIFVKWYWRVSVARPDAPFPQRLDAAHQLAAEEVLGVDQEKRAIERWLIGLEPAPPYPMIQMPEGASDQEWAAVTDALYGVRMPKEEGSA